MFECPSWAGVESGELRLIMRSAVLTIKISDSLTFEET